MLNIEGVVYNMRKNLIKLLTILVFEFVALALILESRVFASQASISAGSVNVGQDLNVTLNVPSSAIAAQADITIKFADGKTKTGKIAYMNGLSSNSMSVSTSDVAAGGATITASNIVISDSSGNAIESGGSTSASVNIGGGSSTSASTTTTTSSQGSSNDQKKTENQKTTTTKAPVSNPSFKDINETVYTTTGINVRSSCSTDGQDNVIGGLAAGQEVTRTGNSNGWSRILYNGKPAYVASRLLTTEKPENAEETEETEATEEGEEKSEIDRLKEEIGVLPEVGTNIATIIFLVTSVASIVVCGFVLLYIIKEKK